MVPLDTFFLAGFDIYRFSFMLQSTIFVDLAQVHLNRAKRAARF